MKKRKTNIQDLVALTKFLDERDRDIIYTARDEVLRMRRILSEIYSEIMQAKMIRTSKSVELSNDSIASVIEENNLR